MGNGVANARMDSLRVPLMEDKPHQEESLWPERSELLKQCLGDKSCAHSPIACIDELDEFAEK